MHIGIDARFCGFRQRGIGRYLEKLIEGLSRLGNDHRYTLFSNKESALPRALDRGKFRITEVNLPWYSYKEQLRFPFILQKSRIDLMHWPNFNVPIFCPVPFVVTIHDLVGYHYPNWRATALPGWRYKFKHQCFLFVLKRAIKSARKIITVSQFTQRDLARHFALSARKIQVVYLAAEKMLLETATLPNPPAFENFISQTFGINSPFFLYVGSFYPHKNLSVLLAAWQILRRDWQRDWQLALVGRKDFFFERLHAAANLDKYTRPSIIFTGEVSDKILDGLYRSARAFVSPSYGEGFGLPALEAASRGLPVLAARAGALPEILGEAAYYFNPGSASALASAMNAVGGSAKIQTRLAQAGFERLKHFDWDKTARETVQVYEQANLKIKG